MEKISMVDLRKQYLHIKPDVDRAIQEVLDGAAFIQGPQVAAFSEALSKYNNDAHVVTCANGTDALQIALMALNLAPGDEVVLPVFTYVATAEVIALLRLTPVFIDVDPLTFNLNVDQLEQVITTRTKAIVPVHLFGQCAHMEPIMQIAAKHKLFVVEDAAQSLGADYRFSDGRKSKSGTIGNIGCTSFFPSKNLGCYGDGGAMFAGDPALASLLKVIANHGQKVKYHHSRVGVNSRLDTLQAAILLVKLRHLDEYTAKRQAVAKFYDESLAGTEALILPHRVSYSTHVFNQYTVQVRDGKRDALKQHLHAKGIPTMIYYPIPLHLQEAYTMTDFEEGAFPIAERLSKAVLSLPIHTEMTDEELSYIASAVKEFFS